MEKVFVGLAALQRKEIISIGTNVSRNWRSYAINTGAETAIMIVLLPSVAEKTAILKYIL